MSALDVHEDGLGGISIVNKVFQALDIYSGTLMRVA